MKIYLDDVRPTPAGWIGARWPEEVIEHLKTGKVDEISLDHDLGEDEGRTGYQVVTWIEEQVALHGFVPPAKIHVHSANSVGRQRMEAGIRKIRELHEQNLRGAG